MNITKTGINGFDELVEGGLPQNSITLLTGTPGTGKTIFGLEFLYRGALMGEKGLYISFEEPKENIIKQAKQFGWDLAKLEKEGKLVIDYIPSKTITNAVLSAIPTSIKQDGIKRIVIDSVSTLSLSIPTIHTKVTEVTEFTIKRFIYNFIEDLRLAHAGTILLIGQSRNDKELSSDGVSEFVADGIIHVMYESLGGEYSRSLNIRKMRQCKNNEDIHPLEISSKGLVIHTIK